MNILPKVFTTEVFYYSSDKSEDALKEQTQHLISKSKTLIGKMSSNEFRLYAYPTVIFYPFVDFRTFLFPHLVGEIYTDKTTCIKLSLNPSLWNVIGFFMLLIAIPFYFLSLTSKELSVDPLFNFWICAMPILVFLHIYITKKWLRNKVVSSLGLTPKE